jgi:hypothetical protein
MALEQLAVLPHPVLHEEHRSARHLHLDQNRHNQQHRPKEKQANERNNSIENPL